MKERSQVEYEFTFQLIDLIDSFEAETNISTLELLSALGFVESQLIKREPSKPDEAQLTFIRLSNLQKLILQWIYETSDSSGFTYWSISRFKSAYKLTNHKSAISRSLATLVKKEMVRREEFTSSSKPADLCGLTPYGIFWLKHQIIE